MQPKIVIVGYPPFSKMAKEALQDVKIPSWAKFEVTELPLEFLYSAETIRHVQSLFNPATIVISGDRSAQVLRKYISNLVIPVEFNDFEFLDTMQSKDTREIIILNFIEPIEEVTRITPFLNVNIRQIQFHDMDEAISIFQQLRQEGVTEVVGGSWVCETAPAFGMKGIFYYSRRSLKNAFKNALHILKVYRSEMEKAILFKTIVDVNRSGIIFIDAASRVKIFNKTAEIVLGAKKQNITDKPITDVIPHLYEQIGALPDSSPLFNIVFEENYKKIAADIVPVFLHGEKMGHILALDDVANLQEMERKIRRKISQKPMTATYTFSDIISSSQCLQETVQQAKKYSLADSSIHIYGESGTGKELFAQSIHRASQRSQHPFVAVNCAALPESLIDSELFGYEEGSFTGAKKGGKIGLFELAHQGTIFLDEISELPLHLQSRLLRVLQEKEIVRIGGDQLIPIDVRIITASNKDLAERVKQGSFREDLYYRISVLQLHIPPLRQRKEDIPLLFRHFMKHRQDLAALIMDSDLEPLLQYHWPGNIRELQNVAERFLVLCQGEKLDRNTIRNFLQNACGPEFKARLQHIQRKEQVKPDEWEKIQLALQEANGNKERAAKLLGISRSTLWRKLKAGRYDSRI